MAFSLAQASPEARTYPLPWAPQIRSANRRRLGLHLGLLVLIRVVMVPVGLMVFAGLVLGLFDSLLPGAVYVWMAGMLVVFALLVLPFMAGEMLMAGLVRAHGHGRAGTDTVSGRHSLPAGGLGSLNPGLYWATFATGLVISAIVMPAVPGVAAIVLAVAYVCLAALLGRAAVRYLQEARQGWHEERVAEQIAFAVLQRGERAVAVVTSVVFRKMWLDQQPVFVLRAVHPCRGMEREVEFTLVDYPRWAPVVGNEFDVWFDPDHLDDPRYTLLERRIVGQRFQPDIEDLRRPESGGDGPDIGPVEPSWVKTLHRYPSLTAEEVHQALRSADPQALPRLKALHGYTVGKRHTRD